MNAFQNTDSICPGEPVLFTTSVTGGIGPPYQFFDELGNVLVPPMYQYPAGTTTYVIIAQDACGLSDSDTLTINVLPQPPVTFYPDVSSGCQPLLVNFVESNPDLGQTYLWDFGDNANLSLDKNPSHVYDDYGLFDVTVTVTSVDGCKTTVTVQDLIDVWPKPLAAYTWSPEFGTIIKPIIDFTNHTQFGNQYIWTFGDGDSSSFLNPYHRFPDAGNWPVSLTAISDKGCRDTVTYYIVIQDEFTFYAPTAFSPDNDLVNDVFYFSGHGVDAENFYCAIYNRWGELIWESDQWSDENPEQYGWDGRSKNGSLVEIGTYTWYVELRDFKKIRHVFSGAITVVR
jgi:gliding motility-associated-like protein